MYSRIKRAIAVFPMVADYYTSTTGKTWKIPVLDDMTEAERQVLLCGGCNKVFVEPKILACGHTVCADCISTMEIGGTVLCHVCYHEQEVARMKPDFRLQCCLDDVREIKDALKAAGNRQPCNHDKHPANKVRHDVILRILNQN